MGGSNSKDPTQTVKENGAINSNFIVQESEYNISKDMKIVLYLILAVLVLNLIFKAYKMHKRNLMRRFRREATASRASVAAI